MSSNWMHGSEIPVWNNGPCLCADIEFASLCCGIISVLSVATFLLLHCKIFRCYICPLLISWRLLFP